MSGEARVRTRGSTDRAGKAGLSARFQRTRRATVDLAAPLSPEDCQVQSTPTASPVKWHLAHTTWFFETFVLERASASYRAFQPEFRTLFNSYYVSVGASWARPQRGLLTRPSLEQVHEYRAHVDARIQALLERGELDAERTWLVELGLNHEQQHQELLLTDVKHLLAQNPLHPVYREPIDAPRTRAAALRWHAYGSCTAEIGHSGDAFAFDNERPRHRVVLEEYELASRPATNGDFLAFVNDGGYARAESWLSEGWETVRTHGWRAPLYWIERGGSWLEFTLGGVRALDLDAPVSHISGFEADAFARWSGARLPTEAEWEHAARELAVEGHFADSGRFHPVAATATRTDVPAQMFGDVWEWTSSDYAPYPGFRPWPGDVAEYNGKFMCNQRVLRGGSCVTPRGHVRASYRNFFPLDARWQFSGVRLARDTR